MKIKSLISTISLCVAVVSFNADATVITFEDVVHSSGYVLRDGYQGFDWDNSGTSIGANDYNYYLGTGFEAGAVSGVMTAYNFGGDSPTYVDKSDGGAFDFNGAYWTSVWNATQTLSFEGWNNSVQLYSSASFSITNTSPLWIGLDWTGIDRLVINNTGSHWSMDNFTYNEEISTVPTPAAIWLFGTGLAGLGFSRRRKV